MDYLPYKKYYSNDSLWDKFTLYGDKSTNKY